MSAERTCLISGTGGYLGGRLEIAMRERGWRVRALTRNPRTGSASVHFQLGEDVAAEALAGANGLVHCAYDFTQLKWPDIRRINVLGTEKLFEAARRAGVGKLIYISTISAYEGCRSLYGKAKLEAEAVAARFNAAVIRPGLIWGEEPGAMYGRLVKQVGHSSILLLCGGGLQVQYLVHERDLAECIGRICEGKMSPGAPITVANEQPWAFRQILEEIARGKGKRIRFLPVPWRLVWAGLKTAETCGVRLGFRSDSLVSLMYQNPKPSFEEQRRAGVVCRSWKPGKEFNHG
ncbi:MAG: hypothetical protein C5B50_06385 [Verrucomicrobia bacterium]|nr:MAG: hypothetical protein C5B50_06385 [Verrucomicrobiota bacterium]